MGAMRPIYQPLHGQAGVQASRWGDNPEACGIRVVIGITVGLLVSFAVVPLMFPGLAFNLEAGRQQQQMESKTLIIPLVETTTTTTLTSTTTTATTTTTAPPAPTGGRVPALVPALVPAATAARRESTTASRTTTTMTTTTTTTTTTTATSTTPTTTTITTTATTETSTTTTLTTTASTATTTTTPSAARLARLKCQKQTSDASLGQLRFPLSFECDEDGSCPSGWTCKGRAVACAADGSFSECAGGAPDVIDAKRYLSVGGPGAGQASLAASPIFMLPHGAKEVSISFSGDGPHVGMSLHMASNGDRICKAASDKALRGGALSTALCKGLSLHGGQGVYLLIQSSGEDAQASLFVKDIHFLDQDGQDMDSALVIPGVKPKLPKLKKEHKDSSSRSAAASWLEPPADCCEDGMPVIATYAGKDKLPYIDGAVMLGLSLQWHVPEFPRLCLVIKSMAQENKDLLTAAGWTLIDVDEWHPHQDHFAHDYWWMIYNKIDVFRVKVDKLLWLDSDMYVWDDSLREVLESTKLPKDHIAMVEDCNGKNFNSGLMLFEPSLEVYQSLREGMVAHHGWDGLDQPLINQEYSDRIVELGAKFNTHGSAKTCEGVVVAHYTGRNKPTLANVDNLRRVSEGFRNIPYSLKCPHLYEEFFCAMKNARVYLSGQLQAALKDVGKGHACMA